MRLFDSLGIIINRNLFLASTNLVWIFKLHLIKIIETRSYLYEKISEI